MTLWNRFELDMFNAGNIPYQRIVDSLSSVPSIYQLPINKKIPGILRSLGDFFIKTPDLRRLISHTETSEELVEILSRSIFYMGKHSHSKSKARKFCIDYIRAFQPPNKLWWNKNSIVPISFGANYIMSVIGPLKNQTKKNTSEWNKISYFNRFYFFLLPNQTWKLAIPFEIFRKPIEYNKLRCQEIIEGCNNCPLDKYCNKYNA